MIDTTRIHDEIRQKAGACAVPGVEAIDDGVGFVRYILPAGISRRCLEGFEMIQHEVRRACGRVIRAAIGPIPEPDRPLGLVDFVIHNGIDDIIGRLEIVDRTAASPLLVGEQQ
ncbi:hypothetical protein D3C81_1718050 [compost metagenome]